jgi:hypothetical protein
LSGVPVEHHCLPPAFCSSLKMTMAIDHQQRFGGGLNFDHMPYTNTPQFTNPWTSSGPQSHSIYTSSQIDLKQQQQQQQAQQPQQAPPRMHGSVGSFATVPLPASSGRASRFP